tara:strand:- start:396 stop:605 length:210 start_codon:yes stop_codon:yes gene_type:complete
MKTKKSGPRPKKYSREWDWKYANRGWRYKRDAPYDKEWQEDRRKLFKEAGNGWWYTQGIYRCSDSLKRR